MVGLALALTVSSACGDDPPAPPPPKPAGAGTPATTGLNVLTGGSPTEPPPGSDLGAAAPAEPPPAPAAAAAATVDPGAEDPAAEEEEGGEVPYAYSPIGKRDPFRNLFEVDEGQDEEELTELQKFELDQLRLVAVVSRIATPYAMVEDPGGKGHTLTRGTLIGKNWGQVAEIRPDCVVVREEYRDYTGRKVTNRTSLCLPKPEELKID